MITIQAKHKHWDQTCGDNCCYEWGVDSRITYNGIEYSYSSTSENENLISFFKEVFKIEIDEETEYDYENIEEND